MLVPAIAFIVVFTAVVIVHEFGHFIAAKKAGVKVYEFSIGFPFSPIILKLFRHKETAFTLRLLPLGGFVSFSEEGEEEATELFEASRFKRAVIMSAGSIFNVIFAFLLFIAVFVIGKDLPFTNAALLSAKMLWEILAGAFVFIFDLVSGSGSMEGLSGPVGIASMAGQAAGRGLLDLLYFTGILSMSLGIINLLPLPALDGGQLTMLLVEVIRRKPLSQMTYQAVTVLGLLLFLVLTVIVTYKDVAKLVA
jgi:regulator of sigma E protease